MHDEEGQYEGLTERLGMVDYESHYMAPVMGSMYLIMLFNFGQFIFLFISKPFRKCHHRFFKFRERVKKGLMWNWILRLLMETSLELVFCCLLNFPYLANIADVKGFFEGLDYFMTIFIGLMIVVFPVWVAIFYNVNYDRMGEE
jgi:hypothetical protein